MSLYDIIVASVALWSLHTKTLVLNYKITLHNTLTTFCAPLSDNLQYVGASFSDGVEGFGVVAKAYTICGTAQLLG